MKYDDLPQRWARKLKSHLREELGLNRDKLSAEEFNNNHLKLNFADGSFAFFNFAFYLLDEESKEVAVFTEHCGYHIFPLLGTELELLEPKWPDVETK